MSVRKGLQDHTRTAWWTGPPGFSPSDPLLRGGSIFAVPIEEVAERLKLGQFSPEADIVDDVLRELDFAFGGNLGRGGSPTVHRSVET
jgi:hypothetical protein